VKPEITVIIPTRNRCNLLQQTMTAVLRQQDVTLDVIVVDDGSTEDTWSTITRVGDTRVRLLRHERTTGVSTARNDGANAATGEWLAFCDDDDLWAPDKLSRQLSAARSANSSWAYGGAVQINDALSVLAGTPPLTPELLVARLPRSNVLPGGSSNAIVRADLFREAGGWDPTLMNLADWDLWIRLAKRAVPVCVPEPLVGYRIHDRNASRDRACILREAKVLNGRYDNEVDFGELHHYLAWVCLRSRLRAHALKHFALAAVYGQVQGVSRSVSILIDARLRRMTAQRVPYYHPSGWRERANTWLSDLRRELANAAPLTSFST
jgi:glycosyltransferase involved in cell wall biosynthesis